MEVVGIHPEALPDDIVDVLGEEEVRVGYARLLFRKETPLLVVSLVEKPTQVSGSPDIDGCLERSAGQVACEVGRLGSDRLIQPYVVEDVQYLPDKLQEPEALVVLV